jgi:hypothetical protein
MDQTPQMAQLEVTSKTQQSDSKNTKPVLVILFIKVNKKNKLIKSE